MANYNNMTKQELIKHIEELNKQHEKDLNLAQGETRTLAKEIRELYKQKADITKSWIAETTHKNELKEQNKKFKKERAEVWDALTQEGMPKMLVLLLPDSMYDAGFETEEEEPSP